MTAASMRNRGLLYGGLGILAVIAITLVAPSHGYYLNIMMQAATYAIAVAGIVIVLGYCGQISLCQAAFLGIGAYSVALGTVDFGLPFFVSLGIGVAVTGIGGTLLGLTTLRLGGHYIGMVTISFQMIVTMVLTNWLDFTHGPDGISGIPRPSLFGLDLSGGSVYLGLCLLFLGAVTMLRPVPQGEPARARHAGGARQRPRRQHLRHQRVPHQGHRVRHQRRPRRARRRPVRRRLRLHQPGPVHLQRFGRAADDGAARRRRVFLRRPVRHRAAGAAAGMAALPAAGLPRRLRRGRDPHHHLPAARHVGPGHGPLLQAAPDDGRARWRRCPCWRARASASTRSC